MTTTRRRSRHTRHHPVVLAAGLLLALTVADAALHVIGWLLLTGAIAAGAHLAGRNRSGPARPVTPAGTAGRAVGPLTAERDRLSAQLASVTAARDQLGAHVADLGRQVAEARESMHAAWDASTAPRGHAQHCRHVCQECGGCDVCCSCYRYSGPDDAGGKRAALLADPLSGARPLGPRA